MRQVNPLEYSWQAMHAVDVLQTANGVAGNPGCSTEGNSLTAALIGKSPEKHEVYKWGIGSSILHFFVGRWVDDKFGGAPNHWNIFIRGIDNGMKLKTVYSNYDKGVGVNGYNAEAQRECDAFLAQESRKGNIANFEWKF